MMSRPWSLAAAAIALVCGRPALAQHAADAWSGALELAIGSADVQARSYRTMDQAAARATIAVQRAIGGKSFAFIEVGREAIGFMNGDKVCIPLPSGVCPPELPNFAGTPILLGLGYHPLRRIELRAGVGAGPYHDASDPGSPTVGAGVASAAVSLDIVPQLGLSGAARIVTLPYAAVRTTMFPLTIGLRIH